MHRYSVTIIVFAETLPAYYGCSELLKKFLFCFTYDYFYEINMLIWFCFAEMNSVQDYYADVNVSTLQGVGVSSAFRYAC